MVELGPEPHRDRDDELEPARSRPRASRATVTYTITAIARDTVNLNSTTATRTFTYVTGCADGNAHRARTNGANVQGTVTVSGTATATSPCDGRRPASSSTRRPRTARGPRSTSTPRAPHSVPGTRPSLTDGSLRPAHDRHRQRREHDDTRRTRTVTVDNTPPTGNITAPAERRVRPRHSVTVSSNSADAGSGVAERDVPVQADRRVDLDDRSGRRTASSPYSVSWNTTAPRGRLLRPAGRHDRQRRLPRSRRRSITRARGQHRARRSARRPSSARSATTAGTRAT